MFGIIKQMMHELKEKVINDFKIDRESFVLSMGTSLDYEEAVIYNLFIFFIQKYLLTV